MGGDHVEIAEERPTAAAVQGLYRSVGWTTYLDDLDRLMAGVEGTTLVFTATIDGRLAGMIRALSDGATVVFVQDLLVDPAFHRRGIGSALMEAVLLRSGGVRQTVLLSDGDAAQQAFYGSLGFVAAQDVQPAPLTAFFLQR